jgi:WD40 repeat protein
MCGKNKLSFFLICSISFTNYAMEHNQDKETSLELQKFDFVLKKRPVQQLTLLCKQTLVRSIINKKNYKESLEQLLDSLSKRENLEKDLVEAYKLQKKSYHELYDDILLFLSTEVELNLAKLVESDENGIEHVHYSGQNLLMSKKKVNSKGKVLHYIHIFDILKRIEIQHEGIFTDEEIKNVVVSPLNSLSFSPFLVVDSTYDGKSTIMCTAFSNDGTTFASGYDSGYILVKSRKSKKKWIRHNLNSHTEKITALKFTPQGLLYSSDEAGNNFIWKCDGPKEGWVAHPLPIEEPISLILSNDGTFVVFQHASKERITILDWNLLRMKTITMPGTLTAITYLNNLLIADNNSLSLFDCRENCTKQSFKAPPHIKEFYPNSVMIPQTALFLAKGHEGERDYIYTPLSAEELLMCRKEN